jgi:hypothetical protein
MPYGAWKRPNQENQTYELAGKKRRTYDHTQWHRKEELFANNHSYDGQNELNPIVWFPHYTV